MARTEAGDLTVVAHRGDAKTLLAFDLPKRRARDLAGFTIECRPHGHESYYLHNSLRFKDRERHAQDDGQSPNASVNAPFHKFRWLHVPGSLHQGLQPFYGPYTYVVTPRYLDSRGSLRPLDPDLSASLDVDVAPFAGGSPRVAFTRGYMQSQGFVRRFGRDADIQPEPRKLLFDTGQVAGTNAAGGQFTYADEYAWMGFTARQAIFAVLDEVLADPSLRLEMFAYDFNEPDIARRLVELAKQGRIRMILDKAGLHHSTSDPTFEDDFEDLFRKNAKGDAGIKRGKFKRSAHDKVLIVHDGSGARKVLTGSTNFSVTGLYVNSNHVLVFDDDEVAGKYAEVFNTAWDQDVKLAAWLGTPLAGERFKPTKPPLPVEITFAPHTGEDASAILGGIVERVEKERRRGGRTANVLFAVMQIDNGVSPVYDVLNTLHADDRIFTFGVSDGPKGISLYEPKRKTGVLVTGKPTSTKLPPPFNQVPSVSGHQIHHKFVVCGWGGSDPVVYCGSSNLAMGGEMENGDNLLAIRDPEVVTAFAIEALGLVDHFQFLNRMSSKGRPRGGARRAARPRRRTPPASRQQAAESAGWFLTTSDGWTEPYYDRSDLRYVDRRLFA